MRAALAILGLGLALIAADADAQEARLGGVKIVVPTAKGPPEAEAKALSKRIREELSAAGADIVEATKLTKAFRSLKMKPSPDAPKLARAARIAGAEYVLHVTITKKGWLYSANARLINASTGKMLMDFKAGYYKPKQDAGDRGARIARIATERLAGGSGDEPVGDAPDEEPLEAPEDPPPVAAAPVSRPPAPIARAEPPTAREPEPAAAPPPLVEPARAAPPIEPTSTVGTTVRPEDRSNVEILRVVASAGSRLLHSFNLGSATTPQSSLSYRLDPLAAFSGEAEAFLPSAGLGLIAKGGFSPARFRVVITGLERPTEPRGTLVDLAFGVRLHLPVAGEGRQALKIIPGAGLRYQALGVEQHTADVMHANRSLSPFIGVELRGPVSDAFEVSAMVDAGFVASYNEEPVRDGDLSSGFLIGAGVGARLWLSRSIGIAFDGRFDHRSIALEGRSGREPPPPNEQLTDVTISTKDLQLTLGIAFRI